MAPPKKGILIPPPPPPTSSIPGKNKQRQLSVSTTEIPIRPSLVTKSLGSEPSSTRSERTRRNLQRLKFECNDMKHYCIEQKVGKSDHSRHVPKIGLATHFGL